MLVGAVLVVRAVGGAVEDALAVAGAVALAFAVVFVVARVVWVMVADVDGSEIGVSVAAALGGGIRIL